MNPGQVHFEFTYSHKAYSGIVWPIKLGWVTGYTVSLESDGEKIKPDILFSPSASDREDWDLSCAGEDALLYYDKAMLEEIGEQIAVRLLKSAI